MMTAPSTPDLSPTVAHLHHQLTRIARTLRSRGGAGSLAAGAASALWTIINHSPIRLCDLADRETVSAPTMSRIVAGLTELGYVERTVDPDDGRARLFSATPAGAELITDAQTLRVRALADALADLDPSERDTVHRGFALLAEALCSP